MDELLEIESHNVNALYRKARCWFKKNEVEKAKLEIQKGLEIEPQSKLLLEFLSQLQ